jgi:nicotinamidase-related amidase
MGAVSSILDFKESRDTPTLVLVDLHDSASASAYPHSKDLLEALEKCRLALRYARQHGLPVAFVRQISPTPSFLAARAYPSWMQDITPRRTDMVFERSLPSCYASNEFAQMARQSRGLVLAGLFGETSCLATLIDGYSRSHIFTFLADASVSLGHGGISPDEMHRSVAGIASLYSDVSPTHAWIDRMSRRIGAAN